MCVCLKGKNDRGKQKFSSIRKFVIFADIAFIYNSFMGSKRTDWNLMAVFYVLVTVLGVLQ